MTQWNERNLIIFQTNWLYRLGLGKAIRQKRVQKYMWLPGNPAHPTCHQNVVHLRADFFEVKKRTQIAEMKNLSGFFLLLKSKSNLSAPLRERSRIHFLKITRTLVFLWLCMLIRYHRTCLVNQTLSLFVLTKKAYCLYCQSGNTTGFIAAMFLMIISVWSPDRCLNSKYKRLY